jgi:hypothetical protein
MGDTLRMARPKPVPSVLESVAALGGGLRSLRLLRRIPMACAAERATISRSTLWRVERGDPGVALGIYARVLASYGLLERLERLTDRPFDRCARELEWSHLPKRIRKPAAGAIAHPQFLPTRAAR